MHAPIFYLLNIKIGAQSEQIWHLLRYRTSAPIIGATNNPEAACNAAKSNLESLNP